MTATYANGLPVTPTPVEYMDRSALEVAYRQGATDALTHYVEEIPPHLLGVFNRMRTLCTRPLALQLKPATIAAEIYREFREDHLDVDC